MLKKQAFKRFSEIDVDADGLINFEETFSFANTHMTPSNGNLSSESKQRLNQLRHTNSSIVKRFEELDTNWNGYIEPEEFDQHLS